MPDLRVTTMALSIPPHPRADLIPYHFTLTVIVFVSVVPTLLIVRALRAGGDTAHSGEMTFTGSVTRTSSSRDPSFQE
jgi:hypothetical protein